MPAYSFKERFVPFVKAKTKRMTIRNFRKYPVKPGQPAMLYYGMRTKYIQKLWEGDWPKLVDVKSVAFLSDGAVRVFDTNWIAPEDREPVLGGMILPGIRHNDLTKIQKDVFAWNDGFRHSDRPQCTDGCYEIMRRYWSMNGGVSFVGFISYW